MGVSPHDFESCASAIPPHRQVPKSAEASLAVRGHVFNRYVFPEELIRDTIEKS